ncbi:hypothetical protein VP01_8969g1, partial [Puccinia sorghi]
MQPPDPLALPQPGLPLQRPPEQLLSAQSYSNARLSPQNQIPPLLYLLHLSTASSLPLPIQKALVEASGKLFPISTIHDDLQRHLGLTRKVAQQVHPGQSSIKHAQWSMDVANMPAKFLVFVGKHLSNVSLLTEVANHNPDQMPDKLAICLATHNWCTGRLTCARVGEGIA